jgi:hypothetical protein
VKGRTRRGFGRVEKSRGSASGGSGGAPRSMKLWRRRGRTPATTAVARTARRVRERRGRARVGRRERGAWCRLYRKREGRAEVVGERGRGCVRWPAQSGPGGGAAGKKKERKKRWVRVGPVCL